jgi:hypothetical protein
LVACAMDGPEDQRRTAEEQVRIDAAAKHLTKTRGSNEAADDRARAYEARIQASYSTDAAAGYGCATKASET